jgi:hypothetical protein
MRKKGDNRRSLEISLYRHIRDNNIKKKNTQLGDWNSAYPALPGGRH